MIRTIKRPNARTLRAGFPPGVWQAMAVFGFMAAAVSLPGCSTDDTGGPDDGLIAVEFTATLGGAAVAVPDAGTRTTDGGGASRHPEIAGTSPATRTADGGNSWATGDEVGMFMVSPGTINPVTVAGTGADNREYNVTPVTGALTPDDGGVLYYPQSGTVDFIAYYPYTSAAGTDPRRNIPGLQLQPDRGRADGRGGPERPRRAVCQNRRGGQKQNGGKPRVQPCFEQGNA